MNASNIMANLLGYNGYDTTIQFDTGGIAGWAAIAAWIGGIFGLVFYIYFAICLMQIAKRTNTPNGWMAWIPILNIYLMCKLAGKSGWWIILLLIPFVNIIAVIIIWAEIAKKLGKPAWWGVLMLIPIVNIIIPGILAFGKR